METFVIINGIRNGPFTKQELNDQLSAGAIKPSNLVWHINLKEWVPIDDIEWDIAPIADPIGRTSDATEVRSKAVIKWRCLTIAFVLIFTLELIAGLLISFVTSRLLYQHNAYFIIGTSLHITAFICVGIVAERARWMNLLLLAAGILLMGFTQWFLIGTIFDSWFGLQWVLIEMGIGGAASYAFTASRKSSSK